MADEQAKVGALCIELAGIVFPHFTDVTRREKLAVALIEYSRALIEASTAAVEGRIRKLEKDSHPPIDLGLLVRAEVAKALVDQQRRRLG